MALSIKAIFLLILYSVFLPKTWGAQALTEVQSVNLKFYITVDWEGVDFNSGILSERDLRRLERFRERFPDIPMIHFLNAAYYTNGELSEEEVTRRLNRVIKPIDEIGLHLHPWENLTDQAGVKFINGPTYFGESESPYEGRGSSSYPQGHRGGDVPLWAYSKEDIRKRIFER